jgi:hypothetical protein
MYYIGVLCINFSLLEQSTLHRPTLLLCYHCHRFPYGGGGLPMCSLLRFSFGLCKPTTK